MHAGTQHTCNCICTTRQTEIQIDKQTDRQTNRQTDRQTERHTDRQTDKNTDRQTQRQTHVAIFVRTKQHQHANQFEDTPKCLESYAKA